MQKSPIELPQSLTSNQHLTNFLGKTKAGKMLKDLALNENFTFIPQKLINFSVSVKSPQRFLPPLDSKSVTNLRQDRTERMKRHKKHETSLNQPNSSQGELLDFDTAAHCLYADQVLNRDKSLNSIDFTKKPKDISYLMETRKYVKEKLVSHYITKKVDTSLSLISPETQGSFINKSLKQNAEDNSVSGSSGKDNIYTQMLNFTKPSDSLPTDFDEIKGLVMYDGIDVASRASKENSEIGSFGDQSAVYPKVIEAYKVGYGPDAYTEVKDTDLRVSVEKAKDKKISEHRSQNKNLLIPSGRKDVLNLSEWLNKMLESIYEQKTLHINQIFEHVQMIYTACLKEIIRQVAVQCTERGQLLEKIWEAYIDLLDRAIKENSSEKSQMENEYLDEIAGLHSTYQKQLEFQILNFENIRKERDEQISLLTTQKEQLKYLKKKVRRLNNDLKKSKAENENTKNNLEDALLENQEMKNIIKEAGINISLKLSANQDTLRAKKRNMRKNKKENKKDVVYSVFDVNKDFDLFENLNLIDKLEEELEENDRQMNRNVVDAEDYVDDQENLYSDMCVDTADLIQKADAETEALVEACDQAVQYEQVEVVSPNTRKKKKRDPKRTRSSYQVDQENGDNSPVSAALYDIMLKNENPFPQDEVFDEETQLDKIKNMSKEQFLEFLKRIESKLESTNAAQLRILDKNLIKSITDIVNERDDILYEDLGKILLDYLETLTPAEETKDMEITPKVESEVNHQEPQTQKSSQSHSHETSNSEISQQDS